jgi:hypothetical protein
MASEAAGRKRASGLCAITLMSSGEIIVGAHCCGNHHMDADEARMA